MTAAAAGTTVSRFRSEPFRLFFPLGVLLGWTGTGHWIAYATGVTETYSCLGHGLVQLEAFMMAFAVGFLATALPRRTGAPPPSALELWTMAAALAVTTAAALTDHVAVAQAGYLVTLGVLIRFAALRLAGALGTRRPPAAFVLVPIAVAQGVLGAGLLASGRAPALARLFVEQGVFLCLAMGVGGLILPLMSGATPPADVDASPAERRRALWYGLAGLAVVSSLGLEAAGFARLGPLLRAGVVAAGFAAAGAFRAPGRPGLHRRLVWVAAWAMPVGLVLSALLPDLRVPALHVLFIGGFGLMALGVATHVSLGHLGLADAGLGRPPAVIVLAGGVTVALLARLAADVSQTYFVHLAWAAGAWIVGTAAWLVYLGPKLVRR